MSYKIIKKSDFDRLKIIEGNWEAKMQLFADMCRYNTLVAVKKAGSGHLGSSLSAMDITTYLYLNELNILDVGLESPELTTPLQLEYLQYLMLCPSLGHRLLFCLYF